MTRPTTGDTRAGGQPARPHWRCPTPGCTDACYCEPDSVARRLRHVGCDRPPNPLGPVPRSRDPHLEQPAAIADTEDSRTEDSRPAPRATFTVDGPAALERWRERVATATRTTR